VKGLLNVRFGYHHISYRLLHGFFLKTVRRDGVDLPRLARDRFEDLCDVKAVKIPGSEKAGHISTSWS